MTTPAIPADTIHLIAKDGRLYIKSSDLMADYHAQIEGQDSILYAQGDEGDGDTISAKRPKEKDLIRALYGDRECGVFSSKVTKAVLPGRAARVIEF